MVHIPAEAQEVEIKGNNISIVPADAFSQLSHFTWLDLNYNEFERIKSGALNITGVALPRVYSAECD